MKNWHFGAVFAATCGMFGMHPVIAAEPAKDAPESSASSAQLRVFIDPETGKPRPPTKAEQRRFLETPATETLRETPSIIKLPGGGEMVPMGNRLMMQHRVETRDYQSKRESTSDQSDE